MIDRIGALVLDLDGVVVESRISYRTSYTHAVDAWFREALGWTVDPGPGRTTLFDVGDVHALKQHPGFNAPLDVVDQLGAWALSTARPGAVGPVRRPILPERPALSDERAALLDAEAILRTTWEFYAGHDCARVYGFSPSHSRGEGLWHGDRLLLDPATPPPALPLAVFTGRTLREARWVLERFALFETLDDAHLWTPERGVAKPDPAAFARCVRALGAERVLYAGDLAADAETVARYRAAFSDGPEVLFALVGNEGPAERADLHVQSVAELLR